VNDDSEMKKDIFNKAIQQCIEQVKSWKSLMIKAHDLSLYAPEDRENAEREHGNTIRLLDVISAQMEDKKIGAKQSPSERFRARIEARKKADGGS